MVKQERLPRMDSTVVPGVKLSQSKVTSVVTVTTCPSSPCSIADVNNLRLEPRRLQAKRPTPFLPVRGRPNLWLTGWSSLLVVPILIQKPATSSGVMPVPLSSMTILGPAVSVGVIEILTADASASYAFFTSSDSATCTVETSFSPNSRNKALSTLKLKVVATRVFLVQ